MRFVPGADACQEQHGDQGSAGKPGDAALALGKHDEGSQERSQGRSTGTAEREERLCQAGARAGSHAGDAGRFRMEYRRTDADEAHGQQDGAEARSDCQQNETGNAGGHAGGQRIVHGAMVGVKAHQRLQQRGGHLRSEGDEPDLPEIQMVGVFKDWIDRRDQGLQDVVDEMRYAHRGENAERGAADFFAQLEVVQCRPLLS